MGRRHRTPTVSSAPGASEAEELDLQAFSDSLRPMGLVIRDVSNDGNCFFRAVSDQLYGTEQFHSNLRQRACDYILRNRNRFIDFVEDDQSYEEYVADMRNEGVWADHIELQAISMACGVNIRIHQSGKPSYDIRNHLAVDAPVIHLSYHFGEHYASVRPIRTVEDSRPAQHAPLPPLPTRTSKDDKRSQTPPRRPRRHDAHSASSIWKRAQRKHDDILSIVDDTQRAAKAIRLAHIPPHDSDASYVRTARSIERDMKETRSRLDRIGQTIHDGKRASENAAANTSNTNNRHAHSSSGGSRQSGKIRINGRANDLSKSEVSDTDGDEYERQARKQTEAIIQALEETDEFVSKQARKLQHLKKASSGNETRTHKGGKKKEQETKKKERKEKRRREQERMAQGRRDFQDLPSIGSHREPLNIAAI